MKISIVIPCYNSELTLKNVVGEIKATLSENNADDYEIILSNDNSTDNTFKIIKELCQDEKIKGINFSKNFGQHAALMAGLKHTTGDIIVCMDDDGQTPPNQMFKLINAIDENTDVVYARYAKKKHNIFRNFGTYMNSAMLNQLLGKPKDLFISSYFAAKKFIIDDAKKYNNPYPYVIGLVLRTTDNIVNVDIEHHERIEGESGYNFKKLLSLWVNGFTSFSVKPLRISMYVGIVFALAGFLYALFIIAQYLLFSEEVVGWTSLMTIILVSSGILMIILGMVGEYIGRIFVSMNNSPQYVIKEEINIDNED